MPFPTREGGEGEEEDEETSTVYLFFHLFMQEADLCVFKHFIHRKRPELIVVSAESR